MGGLCLQAIVVIEWSCCTLGEPLRHCGAFEVWSLLDVLMILQAAAKASLKRMEVSEKAFPIAAGQLTLSREISRPSGDRSAMRSRLVVV